MTSNVSFQSYVKIIHYFNRRLSNGEQLLVSVVDSL